MIDFFGLIFSGIGLVFVGFQIKAANDQNKLQKNNIKREKALEMADYFVNLIQNEFQVISDIYRKARICDLYKCIEYGELVHFDKYEMIKLLNHEVDEIKILYCKNINDNYSILWDTYINHKIHELSEEKINKYSFFNQNCWNEKRIIENKSKLNEDISDEQLKIDLNISKKELRHFYSINRRDLLNKLEYFSMYFTCNLADEKMVYQSLHQIYLSIVKELYGWIVMANDTNGKDRYYTNIIKLYNIWAKRDSDLLEKHIKNERDSVIESKYEDEKD